MKTRHEIEHLMRVNVDSARRAAGNGGLSQYMRGYYSGRLDSYSLVCGLDELRGALDAEIESLPRAES